MISMLGSDSSASNTVVSFCCQKCGSALKLDSSLLASPDNKFLREITACLQGMGQSTDANISGQLAHGVVEYSAEHVKHSVHTTASANSTSDELDFMLVGVVDQQTAVGGMEHVVRVKAKLFDILSSQAEIDHPLCENCTDELLDDLDGELKAAEEECRSYKEFLEQLESGEVHADDEEDYEQTLTQLKEEEQQLQKRIDEIDSECRKLDADLVIEAGKQNDLSEEEHELLKDYNELKRQVFDLEAEDRSAEHECRFAEMQLDRLIKLNAFNSTFHIWHNGHFGTINGFRLGRLPSILVDWNEINTAWGQTVLLLHALARKMNLTFQRYRLVPYGSHSYMESLEDTTKELPLYCTGGYRFFWDKKFDQAMVAFLDCLQQFKEQVERGDSEFYLPYRMSSGKIEDTSTGSTYSIKVQFNSEEQWTKALKFMLTNLRWGLAWVSSQCANND